MKKIIMSSFLLAVPLLLAACTNANTVPANHDMSSMNGSGMDHDQLAKAATFNKQIKEARTETLTGKEFTVTAKEGTLKLNDQVTLPVWTYNGSVPGSQIRVKQGDQVKITLKNELPEPVTIHWHGVPVPNDMDGIPGVTMNAVQPGKSFTYEFKADVPGTYWYHSHQDSVNQIDKGLYGTFIVEGDEKPDRDYTLVMDEWSSMPNPMNEGQDMKGMDHGSMASDSPASNDDHDMGKMYDIFTINGKSGSLIEPLIVKEGEKVRLRIVNAGNMPHALHLHGHEFTIVSTDGQPIHQPSLIKDKLMNVAPGERYDIEFTANQPGEWHLESHGKDTGDAGMKLPIRYEGTSSKQDQSDAQMELPAVDITSYGMNSKGTYTLEQKYDLEYTMNLGTKTTDHGNVFTINGKAFPDTDPLKVKKGDLVKVKLVNQSEKDLHPMHLHGHFFQVLSKDGRPIAGSPIIKDTLNVKPGEEYVVAFEADNEGDWMFHCHDLHHASAGMVTEVKYEGFKPSFTPDASANNKPE